MTYCIGVKLKRGLLALSDTRINSSVGITSARKMTTFQTESGSFFMMASGLRSVRDKMLVYFREELQARGHQFEKMHEIANLMGEKIRKVAAEDKHFLTQEGYSFNIHGILGGQLKAGDIPRVYLVFPEGNWVEVSDDTPFTIIGNAQYGMPILSECLTQQTEWQEALKLILLSFHQTAQNAADVGYPVDVCWYENDSFHLHLQRYTAEDVQPLTTGWKKEVLRLIQELPDDWIKLAKEVRLTA